MGKLQEHIEDLSGSRIAVLIMDLDDFKEINDALGHHVGDLLLQEIGPRLGPVLRDNDLLARLGGDEFGILLPHLPDQRAATSIAKRLLEELQRPLALEGIALEVSASVGVAVYPTHSDDLETVLRLADVAMYAAKERRTGVEVYSPDHDRYTPGRISLISQVRPALEQGQFVLYYQPKLDLRSGLFEGVEALIRWSHPERGVILPDEFIPLVERTVLVRPLTLLVLNQALEQRRHWEEAGLDLGVAANLSARNLLDLELPAQLTELMRTWGTPPHRVTLELTESALMTDPTRAATILKRLADAGVSISIDDFGTGYSSLSYLRQLPINEIKVDKSFVTNMRRNQGDAMIVRATVDLARNLGLQVVAEGVEDEETLEDLAALGCDLAQGYTLSRPLPHEEITPWLFGRGVAVACETGRSQSVGAEPLVGRPHLRAV